MICTLAASQRLFMPRQTSSSSPPSDDPGDDPGDADAPAKELWWRSSSGLTMAIGAATALLMAILLGLVMTPKLKDAEGERESAAVRPQGPVQFSYTPSKEPYQAPSAAQVTRAYAAALTAVSKGGASELARQGLLCFRSLEAKPTYGALDYCIALDLFGRALNMELAGAPPSPASWFGSVGARHHNAAAAILGAQGDAEARILDIDRMVGRQPGVKLADADPAVAAQTMPSRCSRRHRPRPLFGVLPLSRWRRPAPGHPHRRRRPGSKRPPPEVSPSFDCRFARTLSERQICTHPNLAEADIRLDLAYREAVEAGVPERELRRDQDRWLTARERNGDNVEALSEIYEQRIEELEDLVR